MEVESEADVVVVVVEVVVNLVEVVAEVDVVLLVFY